MRRIDEEQPSNQPFELLRTRVKGRGRGDEGRERGRGSQRSGLIEDEMRCTNMNHVLSNDGDGRWDECQGLRA